MKSSTIIILLILLALLLAVFLIVVCVKKYQSKREIEKYFEAAKRVAKDEYLNYSLKNPYVNSKNSPILSPFKIMLYVKIVKSADKGGFVFDPKDEVIFGRLKEQVSIYIDETTVSARHCKIYVKDNKVLLEDMGSSNGTNLIRKRKEYTVSAGTPVILEEKDIVHVGSRYFQIRIFYYDTTTM